ncbi:unknown protein [Waddlia chondrophila 2032/99]|uniref:Uncharacterized protein n=1 Tax=Waddlia chondrophila 2032/99 TaxID=765953 RepID=F8LCF5_9BACT|nr:hypothetical protein [Waddlia chondrophila]CCB91169.1 unknown protein [Waddlia chondrophila 2032/99]
MIVRFLLLASLIFSIPLFSEEYEIGESGGEEEGLCIPEEECESDEVSYRCRKRCRNRRRCCWRDIDASWPGKMENSFREEMRR